MKPVMVRLKDLLTTVYPFMNQSLIKDIFTIEWIDIANTEYRYTAIRIPVNTGIFNVFF
jgi:hypothetical protein